MAETDPEGKTWRLHSVGLRNAYDLAFNRYGDLFTYDSDMEWDLGTSWYRPPRICLVPSGGEFGWRFSTGKWPAYNADSLGPILNTGPASPTGVLFGYGARFPAQYQEALFVLDWTYGIIHAVHLTPEGSAYAARMETFVSGQPLPVTDAAIGPDGALYFITGGRQVQSGLYRVRYTGNGRNDTDSQDFSAADQRNSRHRLELFHGRKNKAGLQAAWPYLGHPDRFLRGAARITLEHQPTSWWKSKAFKIKEPQALITAMIALARQGRNADRPNAIKALHRIPWEALGDTQKLELLRAYALVFIRLGKTNKAESQNVIAHLDPHYPGKDDRVNVELARVLSFLNAPSVVQKTVALMQNARPADTSALKGLANRNAFYGASVKEMTTAAPQTHRMQLAAMLRVVRKGWTLALRKRYFQWLNDAMANSRGGNLYYSGWQMIREEAVATLSDKERKVLSALIAEPSIEDSGIELPQPQGPGDI